MRFARKEKNLILGDQILSIKSKYPFRGRPWKKMSCFPNVEYKVTCCDLSKTKAIQQTLKALDHIETKHNSLLLKLDD